MLSKDSCLERLIISPKADAGDILEPNREPTAAKRGLKEHKISIFQIKNSILIIPRQPNCSHKQSPSATIST